MATPNQQIVDKYFEAYGKHDINSIKEVMAENVQWYFLGDHPFAGIKNGVDEVVAFFDQMASVMGDSKPEIEKPIVCENENHLIECVHTKVNRPDGINIDHHACVLWTIKDGKITEGRHFFADPEAVNRYFTDVASSKK
ncbi:MAG TPA: nuclear transport factor 2 family protein [Saprospiraceae bacterium]|nr:nuclear transport factor 2 family protein [Saprospiraceae bacterium]